MKSFILMLSAFLFASLANAHVGHDGKKYSMHFKNGALHVYAKFTAELKVNEEANLILEVKDPAKHQHVEIEDAIEVSLWMPGMNHGSAPTQIQRVLDEKGNVVVGQYLVSNVYFIMGGDWEVRVTLTDAAGNAETQFFAVELAGGHSKENSHSTKSEVRVEKQKDRIVYGCHPLEPSWDNPVEGAIVRVQDGQLVLAYYLTSKKWGAVDEFVVVPTIEQRDGFYFAMSEKVSLEIDLRESSEIMVGEHPALLKFGGAENGTEMFCLKDEF